MSTERDTFEIIEKRHSTAGPATITFRCRGGTWTGIINPAMRRELGVERFRSRIMFATDGSEFLYAAVTKDEAGLAISKSGTFSGASVVAAANCIPGDHDSEWELAGERVEHKGEVFYCLCRKDQMNA